MRNVPGAPDTTDESVVMHTLHCPRLKLGVVKGLMCIYTRRSTYVVIHQAVVHGLSPLSTKLQTSQRLF